jgi:hypothetical protein
VGGREGGVGEDEEEDMEEERCYWPLLSHC